MQVENEESSTHQISDSGPGSDGTVLKWIGDFNESGDCAGNNWTETAHTTLTWIANPASEGVAYTVPSQTGCMKVAVTSLEPYPDDIHDYGCHHRSRTQLTNGTTYRISWDVLHVPKAAHSNSRISLQVNTSTTFNAGTVYVDPLNSQPGR